MQSLGTTVPTITSTPTIQTSLTNHFIRHQQRGLFMATFFVALQTSTNSPTACKRFLTHLIMSLQTAVPSLELFRV